MEVYNINKFKKIWNKKTIVTIIIPLLVFGFIGYIGKITIETNNIFQPAEKSTEELYQDVFITLLLPYMQEEVSNYYGKVKGEYPVVDPYFVNVLSVVRPSGYRTYRFIIKLEVLPYIGSHNAVGRDNITIMVGYREVKVIKYEHIQNN